MCGEYTYFATHFVLKLQNLVISTIWIATALTSIDKI